LKERLGIATVKVAGNPGMICRRAALKVGAPGGGAQMKLLSEQDVDVMVTGESAEWETCEYVRDAAEAGIGKAMIVLGHANSEEDGVAYVTDKIRQCLPETVPVAYVQTGDPFRFL